MPRILVVESNPKAESDRLADLSGQALGPLYAAILEGLRHDVETAVISPYDSDETLDLSGFDGIAFTGSSVEWNTDDERVAPLTAVMRAGFAAGIPTIGSCNGMQLAPSVLSGSSSASPNGRKDGLAGDIRLTDAGRNYPMMVGRDNGYAVPASSETRLYAFLNVPCVSPATATAAFRRLPSTATGSISGACSTSPNSRRLMLGAIFAAAAGLRRMSPMISRRRRLMKARRRGYRRRCGTRPPRAA